MYGTTVCKHKKAEDNVTLEKHLLIKLLNYISTNGQISNNQAKFNRVYHFWKSDIGKNTELQMF